MQCLQFLSENRREAFNMFPKRKKFQWFRILGMFSVLWHAQHTRVHRNSQKNESIHCNYICKKNFARGWLLRDFTLERVKDWWCVKDWSLTVVIMFYFFCFLTPLDAWMWLKRNGWIRRIWCIFFFEATRFMHSQHACDNNSPCIPLYKSLWKAGAEPDQRANPEENFSRVWAVPRCGHLPSVHGNNRLLE